MSKDELSSLFYKTPSSWGDCENTPCSVFAKGPRFLNLVMTFVLHPLSHNNSITELHACFFLSGDLTKNFPSHFIFSLIDVYKHTVTRDKLIFPSAITRIIRHSSVPYLELAHFTIMDAISASSIWRSKPQLRLKRPRTETTTPPAHFAPSTSAPSSSFAGGVMLDAVMAQLECMDAHLNTLSTELYQVNTRVSCIAWW